MKEQIYWVYILTNWNHSVLYIGVTGNIEQRIHDHRKKIHPESFTAKYNCTKCVFFETSNDAYSAIEREKQLKKWSRTKKDWLIGLHNPEWKELLP